MADADFAFDTWATEIGLNRKTTLCLTKEDCLTKQDLLRLSEPDIRRLGLSIGQTNTLLTELRKLGKGREDTPESNDTRSETSSTASTLLDPPQLGLSKEDEVEKSLDKFLKDGKDLQETGATGSGFGLGYDADPCMNLTLKASTKKAQKIINHVPERIATRLANKRKERMTLVEGTDGKYTFKSDDAQSPYLTIPEWSAFRITNKEYPPEKALMKNYLSCTKPSVKSVVEKQIKEEVENGRYKVCEKPMIITSALGAIPKPEKGKYRLIHDCSRPLGKAVNDLASQDPFAYTTFKEAVHMIRPGTFMAKLDLQSAYRSVKVHQADHSVLGLSWMFEGNTEPTYLYDTRLPFGARLSPSVFNTLSQAVKRIMALKGHKIIAYCDDFLCTGNTFEACLDSLNTLLKLCRDLGFAINYNKVMGPTTAITFLGINMDSDRMTVGLPFDKACETLSFLQDMASRRNLTKQQLQRIAGKVNWAGRVLYGGKCYVYNIYDRIKGLQGPWHKSRVTQELRKDLRWWIDSIAHHNGYLPIVDDRPPVSVSIDACTQGGGAVCDSHWCYVKWEDWPDTANKHINYKEVLSLEPATHIFAPYWRHCDVLVYCDSRAAVGMINKGRAHDKDVREALERIYTLSLRYDFRLKAIYYPGKQNGLADAVSRCHEKGQVERLIRLLGESYFINDGAPATTGSQCISRMRLVK